MQQREAKVTADSGIVDPCPPAGEAGWARPVVYRLRGIVGPVITIRNRAEALACLLDPDWPDIFSPAYLVAKNTALSERNGEGPPGTQLSRTAFIAALEALGADVLTR